MKKLLLLLLFSTASFSQINLQPISPYAICEHPYDGMATFLLNTHNGNVLGALNPQLYSVAYFQTVASAQVNSGALPNQYTSGNVMLAVRVWENVNPANYAIGTVELKVEAGPPTVVFESQFLCQDPLSGDVAPLLLNTGLDTSLYTFEWIKGGNLLPDTSNSLVVTEPGYYTVGVQANTPTGCITYSSVLVMLSGIASVTLSITTDDVVVSAIGAGDYEYQLDNGPYQDSPVFNNVAIGQHNMSVIDMNGCGITLMPFAIISNFVNNFSAPNDLYACTTDGTIPATFNLTLNNAVILSGANPDEYTITYHNGGDPFENPAGSLISDPQQYSAIVPNQVVSALVTQNSNPYHKAVYDFMLVSGLQPLPGTVTAININDNDNDGQATVDLTSTTAQILNGQSNTVLSVTYHLTQADAESGLNTIQNPQSFITWTRMVYFRVSYNGFCNAAGSFQVNVVPAMSVQDNAFSALKIYPNPAQDVFTISNASAMDTAEIYTITGRLVKTEDLNGVAASLNIADLQAAIYLVKIKSGNAEKVVKLIRQ